MKFLRSALPLVLGVAFLAAATPASAQVKHLAGGYFLGSWPTGDWGEVAGFGTGLDATDIIHKGPEKLLSWRVTTSLLYNWSRTQGVPQQNLAPTSKLDLETKNWSLMFGIGPELAKHGASVTPFVYATAGFDTYWTSSTLSGTALGLPYSADHGDSRITFAWASGLGARREITPGHLGEISLEYRAALNHHFVIPDQVTESGGTVVANRDNHTSNQFLLRVGTVFSQ